MRNPIQSLSNEELLSLSNNNSAIKNNITALSDEELLRINNRNKNNQFHPMQELKNILQNLPENARDFLMGSVENPIRGAQALTNLGVKAVNPYANIYGLNIPDANFAPQEPKNPSDAYQAGNIASEVAQLAPIGALAGKTALLSAKLAGKAASRVPTKIAAKILQGNMKPETLAQNLSAAQGTETPLGDIIGNAALKKYLENTLTKVPFVGANQALERAATQTEQKGQSILSNLLGKNDPVNVEKQLLDSLKENHAEIRNIKNKKYENLENIAKDSEFKPDLSTFNKNLDKHIDSLENMDLLKTNPEVNKILSKIKSYKGALKEETETGKLVDRFGNPLTVIKKSPDISLKEANIFKGYLDKLASDYAAENTAQGRHNSQILSEISRSLKKDIGNSVHKSNNSELVNAYRDAENYYAKNYSKFLEPNINKFLQTGKNEKDSDKLVSSFIKTGKSTDQANLIHKLSEALPEDKKDLLSYSYLSRAIGREGNINQNKLVTLLGENALGNRQFNTLFRNPELRKQLNEYKKLVKFNQKGITVMENPLTGQQTPLGFTKKITNLPLGRFVTKKLTSEKTRENLVKEIIKNKNKASNIKVK